MSRIRGARTLALVALVAGVTTAASARERAPAPIRLPEVRLVAGECEAEAFEPVQVDLALDSAVDIVISIDLTQGTEAILAKLAVELPGILADVRAALSGRDVRFGLVTHLDYADRYTSCNYRDQVYGDPGAYPFRLVAALGASDAELTEAVSRMTVDPGCDSAESYGRVIWEVAQPDSGIGLRPDAMRLLLMFCNSPPHDCNLTEGLEPFDPATGKGCRLVLVDTGKDPGRDAVVGTGDDIDFQDDALAALEREGIRLVAVYSGSSVLACYWQGWAERTGGSMLRVRIDGVTRDGSPLGENIVREIVAQVPQSGAVEATLTGAPGGSGLEMSVEGEGAGEVGGPVRLRQTWKVAGGAPVAGTRIEARVVFTRGGVPLAWQPVLLSAGDVNPPEIAVDVEVVEAGTADAPVRLRVGFLATDACDPAPAVAARLGDRDLAPGAEIELPARAGDEDDVALRERRTLVVRARDAAGNERVERVVLDATGRE